MDAFIGSLLERLLATSLQTIALAAIVWLLVRLVPRLSPAMQCCLWWLVTLQALLGLVADPVQLPWLPPAEAPAAELVPAPAMASAASVTALAPLDRNVPAWQLAAFVLWACGVAAMTWVTVRHWARVRRLLRNSSPCPTHAMREALLRACVAQGIRRPPHIRHSRDIDSPLLVGHVNPVLLMPERIALNALELDMALVHELTHLRRGDLWWGLVPALARHLFFFHPFVHVAAREYALAREADCDAAVVRLEHVSRHDYGSLLLRLGTRPGADRELAMASSTFHALSRRLTMLQKTAFLPRTGALAIVAIVCATGLMPLRLVAAAAADPAGTALPTRSGITSIDFRRSQDGAGTGRLIVGFEQERVPVTLSRQGDRIVVDFAGVELPAHLHRRYDVSDFATAVNDIEALNTSNGAQLLIATTGEIGLRANQSGTRYELEIQSNAPAEANPRPAPASQAPVYTGERMSAAFERIPTRTLLQLIAETGGRKIIIDDSVTGYVTLKIDNVPWDQALDIALKIKGLGMRMQGDTMFVAPSEVLARQE